MPDELDLDLPPAVPKPVLVRPKITLEAMCWQPDDIVAAAACVGWLMASGAEFDHPDGVGGTTTLRIFQSGPDTVAQPGDWIVKGLKAFMAAGPDEFAEKWEPVP